MTEKEFLESPLSQYVLALSKKDEKRKKTIWDSIKKYKFALLGLSAFIVGVSPLYELNSKAWKYFETRSEVRRLLDKSNDLILIDANDEAKQLLAKVDELDANNLEKQKLSSLIDLELILREKQDLKSIQIIENIYKESLADNPKALYLLSTAYIGQDLKKAKELLTKAEDCKERKDVYLEQLINSAKIWILAREYDKDRNDKILDSAVFIFQSTTKFLTTQNDLINKEKIYIPLYNNYTFITKHKFDDTKDSVWLDSCIYYSSNAFNLALKTGNYKYIGKTASGLATIYKDLYESELARKYIEYALKNSELCNDTRGVYYSEYTLGQVELNDGNILNAKRDFLKSLEKAIRSNDLRLQIYNTIELSKCYILEDSITKAKALINQADFLCTTNNDAFGRVECKILECLVRFKKSKDKLLLHKELLEIHKIEDGKELIDGWIELISNPSLINSFKGKWHAKFESAYLNQTRKYF